MTSHVPAAPTSEPRSRIPAWIAPVAVVVLLVSGLGVIVMLSSRANSTDAPPEPAAFATPQPARPMQGYDVRQAGSNSLLLASAGQSGGEERSLPLEPSIKWETLEPVTSADVAVGDILTVIGVPNAVRAFSIRSVVLFPAQTATGADGLPRSTNGFAGHEAARDPLERPILTGKVTALGVREGTTETARGLVPATYTVVTIEGAAGPVTIDLQQGADFALHRIAPGNASEVVDGDRLAFATTDGTPPAILILPGGAQ